MASGKQQHNYHLVDPSPWPLLGGFAAFLLALGGIAYMHGYTLAPFRLGLGLTLVIITMIVWWRDVIKEAVTDKAHSHEVRHGLRIGMAMFIMSEVMFFFAFFFSFFKAWLGPVMVMEADVNSVFENAEMIYHTWPPQGIEPFNPWEIPFINTLILLLSGTTVTWAHHALLEKNQKDLVMGLGLTVILGICFTLLQAYEYTHAKFGFTDGIYASNFFMATGFHGFHVIVGTIFLAVCYFRARKGQFSEKHHLGFEFAAWYWHFVDVVWLFLFTFLYWVSLG